jgi:hypothetical protein
MHNKLEKQVRAKLTPNIRSRRRFLQFKSAEIAANPLPPYFKIGVGSLNCPLHNHQATTIRCLYDLEEVASVTLQAYKLWYKLYHSEQNDLPTGSLATT